MLREAAQSGSGSFITARLSKLLQITPTILFWRAMAGSAPINRPSQCKLYCFTDVFLLLFDWPGCTVQGVHTRRRCKCKKNFTTITNQIPCSSYNSFALFVNNCAGTQMPGWKITKQQAGGRRAGSAYLSSSHCRVKFDYYPLSFLIYFSPGLAASFSRLDNSQTSRHAKRYKLQSTQIKTD